MFSRWRFYSERGDDVNLTPVEVFHYIVHPAGSIEAFPIKAYANRANHDDKNISQLYMTEVKNVAPFN